MDTGKGRTIRVNAAIADEVLEPVRAELQARCKSRKVGMGDAVEAIAIAGGQLREQHDALCMEADELRLKAEELRTCVGASLWCFAVSQAATKAINAGNAPRQQDIFAWWFALPIKDRNDAVAEAAATIHRATGINPITHEPNYPLATLEVAMSGNATE